jgi:hypothetical protein
MSLTSTRRTSFAIAALSSASLLVFGLASPALAGERPATEVRTAQSENTASASNHGDLFSELAAVEDPQLERHKAGGHGAGEAICAVVCLIILILCAVAAA